jgi:hypothetical protein
VRKIYIYEWIMRRCRQRCPSAAAAAVPTVRALQPLAVGREQRRRESNMNEFPQSRKAAIPQTPPTHSESALASARNDAHDIYIWFNRA